MHYERMNVYRECWRKDSAKIYFTGHQESKDLLKLNNIHTEYYRREIFKRGDRPTNQQEKDVSCFNFGKGNYLLKLKFINIQTMLYSIFENL